MRLYCGMLVFHKLIDLFTRFFEFLLMVVASNCTEGPVV